MWATKAVEEATKDYVNSGNWIAEFVGVCLESNKYFSTKSKDLLKAARANHCRSGGKNWRIRNGQYASFK